MSKVDKKLVEAARLALCSLGSVDDDRVEALRNMRAAEQLLSEACLDQEQELEVFESEHTCGGHGFCNGS